MNHYERIAGIIRYIDERKGEQPELATLAGMAGWSPFHFHRLFSTWAGVTPKDFLQCLTLAHAKRLLREGESVLDAALESGLSGPGRLHDLCVNLEAASPGEWKAGGAGWEIVFGFAETPFGECLIANGPRGICHLAFVEETGGRGATEEGLRRAWLSGRLVRDDAAAARLAGTVFRHSAAEENRTPLRAFVRGTAFQVRVWRALLEIPAGSLVTYGKLAAFVGHPKAARAIGSAVGRNPIAYLIPCHRVIRETGLMGDYRWGAVRKRAIVGWESAILTYPASSAPAATGEPLLQK